MSISGKAVICTNPHKFVPYIFSVLQSCYLWETELTYVLPKGKSPKIGECYTVTKSGDLEISDQADRKETERLLAELASRGYAVPDTTEPESKGLTVQMPADFFNEHTLGNLQQICENKATLFKAAFQTDTLDIISSDEKVEFPWFKVEQDGDADAYCTFISMLCEFAKNQSRINRKPDTSDNPKYTMRCFLIRLGMVGAEFKAARKVILRHLSGNSAFRKVGDTDAVSE